MIEYRVDGKWTVYSLTSAIQLAQNEGKDTIEILDTVEGSRIIKHIEELVSNPINV